jgi:phenylalanyl-tRNA synthetase beta chain
MKVSLKWLRELVELPPTVPALVELLTMAGVEVEGIEMQGCTIPNVVVAQIRESVQHPNADRLSVCQVDDGTGTARQIVCGAKNYKVGDKVPLALPGAKLPGDFTIKVGKLRGVESQGMMCSAKELALAEDADGLLILPVESRIGAPIADVFPGDTILDLEITPNRADLLCVVGIAREIATLTGSPFKDPRAAIQESAIGTLESGITVSDPVLCPLYTARIIRGVQVGPSPDWLRMKLEAVGLRTINNIVDITNFVMIEFGQPLHAFDADKLDGGLQVRVATDGEEFRALDGKTYKLAANQLVIADQRRAVAIAGVMGGEETGVIAGTTKVIIESALFQPQSIRRTSRALGLGSDSSYRFERGVDPEGVLRASERATQLIVEIAGGEAAAELAQTPGARSKPGAGRKAVPLRPARVEALLGIKVPGERIGKILTGFGLTSSADGWLVPSFRPDLTREVDLIEEVARVIGMDAIPAREQARFTAASPHDRAYDRAMALRRAFVAQGLHEARSITLVPAQPLGLAATNTSPENCLRVKNPMIEEQVVLRPGLLHGLLTAVRDNLRSGAKAVRLFEIGRVFHTQCPEEFTHAAVVLAGPVSGRSWRGSEGREADLFDLKAILVAALGAGVTFEKNENPALALSLAVKLDGKPIGFAGQLWPAEARALDSTAPVLFAELDLSALWKAAAPDVAKKYCEIPRFPEVTRDIAMLAPLTLAHESVAATLAKAKEPLLAGLELFDVFTDATGAKIPSNQKSLAYSLTYRSAERTLTADEVNTAHAKLKERLKNDLGVSFRE